MKMRGSKLVCVTAVCTALLSLCGCATQNQNCQNKHNNLWLQSFTNEFSTWPQRIIDDSKDTFSKQDNLSALLLAGAASVAMHNSNADDEIAQHSEKHQVIDGFASETLNIIGGPYFHFAATGLWYALSVENHDDFNAERAWTMMTALAVNGAVTSGLKLIRDNDSPNGKRYAWPSGHTSSSFTVAAVLDEFYGPRIGIPAYLLSALVAYRMADEGEHWASDVVFGATLGWVVGHTIAGKHKSLEVAGFQVLPLTSTTGQSAVGINLLKRF